MGLDDVRVVEVRGERVVELRDIRVIDGGAGMSFVMKNTCGSPVRIRGIVIYRLLPKPVEKRILFGLITVQKTAEIMGMLDWLAFEGGRDEMWPGEEHLIKVFTIRKEGERSPAIFTSYSGKAIQHGFRYSIRIDGEIVVGEVGEGHPLTVGSEVTRGFVVEYIVLSWNIKISIPSI